MNSSHLYLMKVLSAHISRDILTVTLLQGHIMLTTFHQSKVSLTSHVKSVPCISNYMDVILS